MAGKRWLDTVLGLGPEWKVTRVEPTRKPKELRVELQRTGGSPLRCPHCGEACPGYDTRRREWRNLDAWGYKTFLACNVPRVQCPERGVVTIQVPWGEGSSTYTAQFEAEVIGWLKEASIKAVAKRMRLSWNAVDGIMERAVARGLARRKTEAVRRLSVDQTSFRRRHRYVTVVSNPKTGYVLHVAPGRGKDVLMAFYEGSGEKCRAARRERQHRHVPALHLGDSGDDPGCRDEDRVRPVPRGQAPRRRRGQGAAGRAPGAG